MQLTRCPVCHSRISLEQLVQDAAGRDLLALVAKLDKQLGMALVTYVGLFRSTKRDLANDRALRLMNEVLALGEPARLTATLAQTVEQMRNKAHQGGFKPLTNHNYLKKVLTDTVLIETDSQGIVPEPTHIHVTNGAAAKRKRLTAKVMDINNTNW